MKRSKEQFLAKLREQADFLLASAHRFYDEGVFAESMRIATHIRTLVHETGNSKPLLKEVQSNGLDLSILDHAGKVSGEEVFNFAVGIRVDRGVAVFPSVDLQSAHYTPCVIGAWWNRPVFSFWSNARQGLSTWMVYTRKQIVLILANKEGGAHVDPKMDPAYVKLLTDQPLGFEYQGVPIETPDLAKFLTAQSGVEMLESLKQNFFSDLDVRPKWDVGTVPPMSISVDQMSGVIARVTPPGFRNPRTTIIKKR